MRPLLLPFSPLYAGITSLRNWGYDHGWLESYRADVPVVSVGNISTGGTGKTPVSEYLLQACRSRRLKVAYLSRGYGRSSKGYQRVRAQAGHSGMYGDEALQVAHKFPDVVVAVCESRKEGIQRLVQEEGVQFVVLDDAFQHRKVQRDLDLLVIDANRLPTRDHVLPAGNLREGLSGLQRADAFIINKVRTEEQVDRIEGELARFRKPMAFCQPWAKQIITFDHGRQIPRESFSGVPVIAFSGIGNPQFFLQQLRDMGLRLLDQQTFPDHHAYTERELKALASCHELHASEQPLLLTTEKDFFRLSHQLDHPILRHFPFAYLPIELKWLRGASHILKPFEALLGES